MTDKEIIIDGIDVSECYGYVHNAKEYDCGETYSKFHYRYCEENPNCYFKQLKRAEQECEKYKQALEEIEKQVKAMNNECFYDDICDCNNCDMKNGCSYYRKFNILNIINKIKEQ